VYSGVIQSATFVHGNNFFTIPTLSAARNNKILQESLSFDKVVRSWSDFVQQRELCTDSREDINSDVHNYLIVKLKPGLCNSMVSLTSSLALALLSKRRLILLSENFVSNTSRDYKASIKDIFEPPAHFGSCWPTLRSGTEKRQLRNVAHLTFLRGPRVKKIVEGKVRTEKIDLLCGSWIQKLSNFKFLEIDSYQAFFLAMYINPWMGSSMDRIGRPTFGAMSRMMFRPKEHIQKEVLEYHAKYLQESPSIGFQVRVAYLRPIQSSIILDFLRCTEKDPLSVFVSTDSRIVRQKFEGYFHNFGSVSYNNTIDRTELRGIESAVRDMWTLASTDTIIGSSVSTFGQCASGLLGSDRRVILSQQRAQLINLRPLQCMTGTTGVCMRQEVWQKLLGSCNFISGNGLAESVDIQMACTYGNDVYHYSRNVSCKSCEITNKTIDSLI